MKSSYMFNVAVELMLLISRAEFTLIASYKLGMMSVTAFFSEKRMIIGLELTHED